MSLYSSCHVTAQVVPDDDVFLFLEEESKEEYDFDHDVYEPFSKSAALSPPVSLLSSPPHIINLTAHDNFNELDNDDDDMFLFNLSCDVIENRLGNSDMSQTYHAVDFNKLPTFTDHLDAARFESATAMDDYLHFDHDVYDGHQNDVGVANKHIDDDNISIFSFDEDDNDATDDDNGDDADNEGELWVGKEVGGSLLDLSALVNSQGGNMIDNSGNSSHINNNAHGVNNLQDKVKSKIWHPVQIGSNVVNKETHALHVEGTGDDYVTTSVRYENFLYFLNFKSSRT